MIGQPFTSLQFIRYKITATVNGVSGYDPTGDEVQFGFQPAASIASDVAPTEWVVGSWETDTIAGATAYVARCLVGPGGAFEPTAMTNYWVWIVVTDNPEIPVLQVGQLQIT